MSSPVETAAPVVHVVTDDQLQALALNIAAQVRAGSPVAQVKAVVQTGAEDVLANIKQLLADAEGTVGHVHGAARQLQADVKANRVMIVLGLLTVFNTIMILKDLFHF